MNGYHLAMILLGTICGNLGAVILPSANLGLFWNTILGICGASGVIFAPYILGYDPFGPWYVQFLSAGLAGSLATILIGGLNELRFRR